jgi:hypothetical protein
VGKMAGKTLCLNVEFTAFGAKESPHSDPEFRLSAIKARFIFVVEEGRFEAFSGPTTSIASNTG